MGGLSLISKIFLQVEDFLTYCQSKRLSQKTIFSYDQTLKLFVKYLEVEHDIKNAAFVTDQVIREYILSLQERGKYTVVAIDRGIRLGECLLLQITDIDLNERCITTHAKK